MARCRPRRLVGTITGITIGTVTGIVIGTTDRAADGEIKQVRIRGPVFYVLSSSKASIAENERGA
jgi:hypothetical protein